MDSSGVRVHVVDGTFELFRSFFGAPASQHAGQEVGATRAFLRSLLRWAEQDKITHCGVAFDTVIESFRNKLFDGYKTGEGVDPALMSQFPLAEEAAAAMGFVVWPMIDFECDDALATAAATFGADDRVEQVVIVSPDKDMAQCVRGKRIICLDRMRGNVMDEDGVHVKFGVGPESIADWLALVGDDADGIPGIAGWGAKSAATVLSRWKKIEAIPELPLKWEVNVRSALRLSEELNGHRTEAALYRTLATLRTDVPLKESLDDMRWKGPDLPRLKALCERIGEKSLLERYAAGQAVAG